MDRFACPVNCGDGKIYIDDSDPIEGHKLSRTMPCPFCHGKKRFDENTIKGKAVAAYWDTIHKLTEEEKNQRNKEKAERARILKEVWEYKLNDKDREVLRHFGIERYFLGQSED